MQHHQHDMLQVAIDLLPPTRLPTLHNLWPLSHLASMTPAPQPMEAPHLTQAEPHSQGKQHITPPNQPHLGVWIGSPGDARPFGFHLALVYTHMMPIYAEHVVYASGIWHFAQLPLQGSLPCSYHHQFCTSS